MMRLWIEGRSEPLEFDDDLAIAIIKTPTCVYKVERKHVSFGGAWMDSTSFYADYINARKQYWDKKRRKDKMAIKSIPKYTPGEVIDLSYKNGGLPNRILITCAFWRQGDKQWMYKVFMESTGDYSVLDETFIAARASKKTSVVYRNPAIISRISDGWRFCGNFDSEVALANGKLIAENPAIKNVRLWPAIGHNNQYIQGQAGIWIIWEHTISNDGTYIGNGDSQPNDVVDIK